MKEEMIKVIEERLHKLPAADIRKVLTVIDTMIEIKERESA